jgi:hypothetical protein
MGADVSQQADPVMHKPHPDEADDDSISRPRGYVWNLDSPQVSLSACLVLPSLNRYVDNYSVVGSSQRDKFRFDMS